jgi:hypothetical protein
MVPPVAVDGSLVSIRKFKKEKLGVPDLVRFGAFTEEMAAYLQAAVSCRLNVIVSGGTGIYYSADNIWIIGRQQDKDADGLSGFHFVINVEKSRYVKEKSKIPITVSFEGGINRWSGLLDVAMDGGYIVKPKAGWYAVVDKETGEVKQPSMRAGDIVDNKQFWMDMFANTDFAQYIEKNYKMAHGSIMGDDDDNDE